MEINQLESYVTKWSRVKGSVYTNALLKIFISWLLKYFLVLKKRGIRL